MREYSVKANSGVGPRVETHVRFAFRTPIAIAFLVFLAAPNRAAAQNMNDQCGWAQGTCQVDPAEVGSLCSCPTNSGVMEGYILPRAGHLQPNMAASSLCRTGSGVCDIEPSTIGSPCNCFGDGGVVTRHGD
jgi:hypothetical protein